MNNNPIQPDPAPGPPRSPIAVAVAVGLCTITLIGWLLWQAGVTHRPDFQGLPDGESRKAAFFGYMRPIVEAENARRLVIRQRLTGLQPDSLSKRDRHWLQSLAARFEIDPEQIDTQLISALLVRIDEIPVSLALAQAAQESGWGTSRFAIEGNNFFGERCWESGCGMVPESRVKGLQFEVRRFESIQDSVASYIRNINTHPDYRNLREYRAEARRSNAPVQGAELAERLGAYSEEGSAYAEDIRNLIEHNELEGPEDPE